MKAGTVAIDSGRRLHNCRCSELTKVLDVLRLLQDEGWYLVATRGSHRQFKHLTKPGRTTVAGKPSDDIAPGTLNSILKQAMIKEKP